MKRGIFRLAMAFHVVDYRDLPSDPPYDSDGLVKNWIAMFDTFGFALSYAHRIVSDDPACSLAEWGSGPYDKLILRFEPGFIYR